MASIFNLTYSSPVLLNRLGLIGVFLLLYILSLAKFSGPLGAIYFVFLFGWTTPGLINFIISYYVAFDLISTKYFALRIAILILVSFMLGVNLKLPYVLGIIPYQPYDFKMTVIQPLESNASFERYGSSLDSLKPSIFSFLTVTVSANEGLIFVSERPKAMLKFPQAKNELAPKTKAYKVEVLALNGKNHVQYEITIKEESVIQIQMQAKYPKAALASSLKRELPPFNSLLFWEDCGEVLLTNNIWQVLLDKPFRIKTFNDLINETK